MLVAIDVGTSGARAAAFDLDGRRRIEVRRSYPTHMPHPGWAEQDAREWLGAVAQALLEIRREVGPRPLRAISFGSQLDGMVPADASGEPLGPALIWMDRRAEAQAGALAERMPPSEFYRLVGANLDSSHAVFKALWVRDEEPDVWRDAAWLMSTNRP